MILSSKFADGSAGSAPFVYPDTTVITLFKDWLEDVSFPNYYFLIGTKGPAIWLQAIYYEQDIISGKETQQHTRKWWLSPHMSKSEFIQTVFKCCLTSYEHKCRETFKYCGKRVFGPHFNIDALHSICGQLDYRNPSTTVDG